MSMTNWRSVLQKISRLSILLVVLLAPLKLGVMLLPGVPQSYPADVFGWLITGWPPAFFVLLAGILLLLAVMAYGVPDKLSWKNPGGKLLVLYMLLPLVALIGFIDADSLESPVIELEYSLGLAAFAGALAINFSAAGTEFRSRLLNMIAWGTLLAALLGVHQYFFGFNDMREFIEMQEKVYQIKISPELKARAYDVRTYAAFTFASALAGMFCLGGALTAQRAWEWGKKFEPMELSQKIFAVLAFVLCSGVFLSTKGRSAFLSVIVAMAICGWMLLKSRKLKIITVIAAAAAIAGSAFYIEYAGRGFGSMTERVGYLKSSWEILLSHPLTGEGWGDFTFHHAHNKSFGNNELAKDPHNFVAAWAAQTGLAGLLLSSGLLLYSLYLAGRRMKQIRNWENTALFFSLSAFSLHVLMDLDWQVTALMIWWCVLMFLAVPPEKEDAPVSESAPALRTVCCGVMLLTALLSIAGGWHWSVSDSCYDKLMQISGQGIGAPSSRMASAYEVDIAARRSLAIAPYSHSVYITWGNDALRRRDYYQAEKRFMQALQMVPRSHAVHERLGEIYEQLGETEKARSFYQRADKLFPYKRIFSEKESKKNE